jgi:RNA-directed DNA polymerase
MCRLAGGRLPHSPNGAAPERSARDWTARRRSFPNAPNALPIKSLDFLLVNARREAFDFLEHRFVVQPSKHTGAIRTYYYPAARAMNAVKKKIRGAVRGGQHRNLPDLIRERINPLLRGWGNYFKAGNSREHFLRIANYTTRTLCIMLRKKYKKRSKGWRDHPPSWF